MAPHKRMTIVNFSKPSALRNFLVRSEDDQVFYVDPNFLKIWSGAFSKFLEQCGEIQPQFYAAPLKSDQLLLFLAVIHAQALVDCSNHAEVSNFIDAIDSLNATECLKEATAFHCLFRCRETKDAQLLIKAFVILDNEAARQLLQHFIDACNQQLNMLSQAVDETLAGWMFGKGHKQVSQQIFTVLAKRVQQTSTTDPNYQQQQIYQYQNHHYQQQQQQQQQQAKQAVAGLLYNRIQDSINNAEQNHVKANVEFVLGETKSVLSNRCLLGNQSIVFQSMLFGDFEDGAEQTIQLPEETSEKFHHHMFHAMLPTLAGCIWRFSTENVLCPQLRISPCLLGIQQSMQPTGQQSNNEQKTLALRRLFEVTDKYDIMAMNAFFTDEIVAHASEFNMPDLIEIGDQYANVKILDAGFGKLNRSTARQMLLNEENVWMNYSLTTKERLLAAVGKLLCTNH